MLSPYDTDEAEIEINLLSPACDIKSGANVNNALYFSSAFIDLLNSKGRLFKQSQVHGSLKSIDLCFRSW